MTILRPKPGDTWLMHNVRMRIFGDIAKTVVWLPGNLLPMLLNESPAISKRAVAVMLAVIFLAGVAGICVTAQSHTAHHGSLDATAAAPVADCCNMLSHFEVHSVLTNAVLPEVAQSAALAFTFIAVIAFFALFIRINILAPQSVIPFGNAPPGQLQGRQHTRGYDPFTEAFRRGILHPRQYDAPAILH